MWQAIVYRQVLRKIALSPAKAAHVFTEKGHKCSAPPLGAQERMEQDGDIVVRLFFAQAVEELRCRKLILAVFAGQQYRAAAEWRSG